MKSLTVLREFYSSHKTQIIFFLLFGAFIFLRFYQFFERTTLGWDQADSAWGAERIIHENFITLQGVPIKGNANMFLGPLYYYLIVPFYLLTNMDMLASPIFAGVVSLISFFFFYHITKKLFDTKVALLAVFFYTFSIGVINLDKIQAAYTLIPTLSYIVFYCLYRFINGSEKYALYLAIAVGFGFHIHFTSFFYLIIILLAAPFFPRTKKSLQYILLSIPVFLLFLSPMLISIFLAKHAGSNGILSYLGASYHGLHLRRVMQLPHDAFISFQAIFQTKFLEPFDFILLPAFAVLFYFSKEKKERRKTIMFIYLVVLWILVPWLVFSTYNGELTDYYFFLPRNLGFAMIAFIILSIFTIQRIFPKLLIAFLMIVFAVYNIYAYLNFFPGNFLGIQQTAKTAVQNHSKIYFKDRDPLFYEYYIYSKYRNNLLTR